MSKSFLFLQADDWRLFYRSFCSEVFVQKWLFLKTFLDLFLI